MRTNLWTLRQRKPSSSKVIKLVELEAAIQESLVLCLDALSRFLPRLEMK